MAVKDALEKEIMKRVDSRLRKAGHISKNDIYNISYAVVGEETKLGEDFVLKYRDKCIDRLVKRSKIGLRTIGGETHYCRTSWLERYSLDRTLRVFLE